MRHDNKTMKLYYEDEWVIIIHADCRDIKLGGISAVVTDPPYGLGFMGKEWDTFDKSQFGRKGSEGANDLKVKKNFEILPRYKTSGLYKFIFDCFSLIRKSCLAGAPLLSFGGSRTQHRIACAIEDAGWEIRDTLMWVYGSGFPKSLDISKAIEGVRGKQPHGFNTAGGKEKFDKQGKSFRSDYGYKWQPSTPEAKLWEGYGTALKPAYEPIILAMNPLDGTFANNALKYGVAGLNIDECRVFHNEPIKETHRTADKFIRTHAGGNGWRGKPEEQTLASPNPQGRFPANFLHDGSQQVMELFPETKSIRSKRGNGIGVGYHGSDAEYDTVRGFNDSGSAARFFYCAKASKAEREKGLENMPLQKKHTASGNNHVINEICPKHHITFCPCGWRSPAVHNIHPTVKPLALMEYLVKLVKMPEYNLILDPFMGSGTSLLACIKLGIPCIGIDSNESSCEIAAKRCSQGTKEYGS